MSGRVIEDGELPAAWVVVVSGVGGPQKRFVNIVGIYTAADGSDPGRLARNHAARLRSEDEYRMFKEVGHRDLKVHVRPYYPEEAP